MRSKRGNPGVCTSSRCSPPGEGALRRAWLSSPASPAPESIPTASSSLLGSCPAISSLVRVQCSGPGKSSPAHASFGIDPYTAASSGSISCEFVWPLALVLLYVGRSAVQPSHAVSECSQRFGATCRSNPLKVAASEFQRSQCEGLT